MTASCKRPRHTGALGLALAASLMLSVACAAGPARQRPRPSVATAVAAPAPKLAPGALLGGDERDLYARAEAHRARGKALYETQHFEEAVTEFSRGYALVPWPVFLFNLGQARRQLGDCRAVFAFRRFLSDIEARSPDDPARLAAEPGVPVARRNLEALAATCATAMRLPTAPRPRRWYERPTIAAAMAGGVVLAGLGGGALALGERRARQAHDAESLSGVDDRVSSARTWRVLGGALGVCGLALSAASYVHHRRHPSLLEEITIEVGDGGATAALRGRF